MGNKKYREITSFPSQEPPQLISPARLMQRWDVDYKRLESWRYHNKGPEYVKIGGSVLYVLEDVERLERGNVHKDG